MNRTRAMLAVFMGLVSVAASADPSRWQLGIGGVGTSPLGAFQQGIGEAPAGVSFLATVRVKNTPFQLGLDAGTLFNGDVEAPVVVTFNGASRSSRGDFDGRVSSSIYYGHFLVRFQPNLGRFSPFVDGLIGTKQFVTSLGVTDPHLIELARYTDRHALSVGGGGGLSWRLRQNEREGQSDRVTSFDVAVRYLAGGEVDYYSASDLSSLASGLETGPRRSRTNMLMITIGIRFEF